MFRYLKYAVYFQYLFIIPVVLDAIKKARKDGKITVTEIIGIFDLIARELGFTDFAIVDDRADNSGD